MIAKIVGVICFVALLHNLPALNYKWIAKGLIAEELAKRFPNAQDIGIERSFDQSNYTGLFNLNGLVPTGGNEEYWDFCLLVKADMPDSPPKIETFRVSGDRAYRKMKMRQVSDFKQCRADQAG